MNHDINIRSSSLNIPKDLPKEFPLEEVEGGINLPEKALTWINQVIPTVTEAKTESIASLSLLSQVPAELKDEEINAIIKKIRRSLSHQKPICDNRTCPAYHEAIQNVITTLRGLPQRFRMR